MRAVLLVFMPRSLHRVRLTAAAAVSLPKNGLVLRRVRVWTGATPGALVLNVDSMTKAVFPVASNGTRGYASYKVNEKFDANAIDSTYFTFVGALSIVELTFGNEPNPDGKSLRDFRAVYVHRDDTGGAATADVTFTFTGTTSAKPTGGALLISASTGRLIFPQNEGLTFAIEGLVSERMDELAPIPDFGESLQSLTASLVSDGANKGLAVIYY